MIGLDTGFFFRLLAGHATAAEIWGAIGAGDETATISCISLYELERIGLRGALSPAAVNVLLADLPIVCTVVWLDSPDHLHRASRLAHGTGLAMADALILSSLIGANAATVYTTDSDFERYKGPVEIVRL